MRTGANKMSEPNRKMSEVEAVRHEYALMMPKIKSALPPHITAEKFLSVAMTAIQTNRELLSLDRQSLLTETLKCAADGLLPDGREAAFMEMGGKVKYIPMIFGIYKKVRNAGDLSTLTSEVVYEKDHFRYWYDNEGANLEFEPNVFGDRGQRLGAFALGKTKDGQREIEVMPAMEIMAVKECSRAKNSKFSPWNGSFENEMWRKTVVRRLSKRLQLSPEVDRIIRADDDMYDLGQDKPKTKTERLLALLTETAKTSNPESAKTESKEVINV